MKINKRLIIIAVILVLTLYIGIYCALSSMGDYRLDQSGKVRFGDRFAMSDLRMWHPKFAWFQNGFEDVSGKISTRGDICGYIFSPMIILDRTLIHKTDTILKPEEFKK